MNIRSLGNPSAILNIEPKTKVDGEKRTVNTGDRDADGRRDQGEPEQKRHMTREEFDDALKVFEAHPGLKANGLVIKVETHEDRRVILVVDPQGQVVRRLSESQLWSATRDKDRQTGKILDKAM